MRRLALQSLLKWKDKQTRVPLLLKGARQVGKTWLVREFAKSFDSFVEINLEAQTEYHGVTKDLFGKPQEFVAALSLLSKTKIVPEKTLLFLDEIQETKEALLALRYFKEQMPDLHVIAAGSLLEFTIKDLSFPVGRIDFLHLFPLNFIEYLYARDRADLVQAIKEASVSKALPQSVHELLINEINFFCLIGGMPEVLNAYVASNDLQEAQDVQQRIVATYREDFYKYASRAQIEHLRKIFDRAPRLLGQKFKYVNIDDQTRSRELGQALNLLIDAGLLYKVRHTSAQGLPLAAQTKEKQFKIYCLDSGLTQRILGLPLSQLFLEKKNLLVNRGPFAEQFVAQEILSYTRHNESPQLYFWHRETKSAKAEVDFVIEHDAQVLPIEVKSHRGGLSKSLYLFMEERKEYLSRALKVSAENYQQRNAVLTIPLYGIGNFLLDSSSRLRC